MTSTGGALLVSRVGQRRPLIGLDAERREVRRADDLEEAAATGWRDRPSADSPAASASRSRCPASAARSCTPSRGRPGTASTAVRTSRRYRFKLLGIRETLDGCRQPHREEIGRVEAGVDVHETEEAAHHQARPDEQHERQRDFGDDQRIAEPLARPHCRSSRGFPPSSTRQGLAWSPEAPAPCRTAGR